MRVNYFPVVDTGDTRSICNDHPPSPLKKMIFMTLLKESDELVHSMIFLNQKLPIVPLMYAWSLVFQNTGSDKYPSLLTPVMDINM